MKLDKLTNMDAETLRTLKASIEKWRRIAKGTGADQGANNCALCKKFLSCDGCPIYERTGRTFCADTPYAKWADHQRLDHWYIYGMRCLCPTCTRLAEEELAFLESLLHKGGAK